MGVGNHLGLVLDMSKGGLEGPGRLVTAIDEWVQSIPLIKSMARIDTEGMQWLISNHHFSYIRKASRQGFLLHPETQRNPEKNRGMVGLNNPILV